MAHKFFVPKYNEFDKEARRKISGLCGTFHRDFLMPTLIAYPSDFGHVKSTENIQVAARELYISLNKKEIKFLDSDANIRFTREGWRHITRPSRPRLTQIQSFHLLGIAERAIRNYKECDLKKFYSKKENEDFVYLNISVSFPHRHNGIVKIIFWRRYDSEGNTIYSFRTIYEPRRRRALTGLKIDGSA